MKLIPNNIKDTIVDPVWKEIELIGRSQGVDPTAGPITLEDVSDDLKRSITTLARSGGASVSIDENRIYVTLLFEDTDASPEIVAPPVVRAKPNVVA